MPDFNNYTKPSRINRRPKLTEALPMRWTWTKLLDNTGSPLASLAS